MIFHPPPVFEGDRKAAFLALAGLAALEAVTQIILAGSLRATLHATDASLIAVAILGAAAIAHAGIYWVRGTFSARFSHAYANAVREFLGQQTIRAARHSRRVGVITVRMTSDLNALRLWADRGLCGGIAAAFSLVGAMGAAHIAAGMAGVIAAGIGPVLILPAALISLSPLRRAIRRRRDARGLLSARNGDLALEAPVWAAFGLRARAGRRMSRLGRNYAQASVAEARLGLVLRALPALALPIGVVVLALLRHANPPIDAGWAGILFALSLAAGACAGLVSAFEAWIERDIAWRKLRQLADEAASTDGADSSGTLRLAPGPGGQLQMDGVAVTEAGAWQTLPRDGAWRSLRGRLLRADRAITLDIISAADIFPRDWARRVAICAPELPLIRGSLEKLMGIGSPANPRRRSQALAIAGLDPDDPRLSGIIDPLALDHDCAARLRLARAIAARPRLLVIDDAWIGADPAIKARLQHLQSGKGLTILWIGPE